MFVPTKISSQTTGNTNRYKIHWKTSLLVKTHLSSYCFFM